MENVQIVKLEPKDWMLFKELRLRALKEEPHAFCSSYEENVIKPDISWAKTLDEAGKEKTQWLVFAKLNKKIVGMIAAHLEKESNTAHIISMYVSPEERGKGIAKKLMNNLLKKLKENIQIKKIIIDVNPMQSAAFNLYKKSGFKITKKYKYLMGDGNEHDLYQFQITIDS